MAKHHCGVVAVVLVIVAVACTSGGPTRPTGTASTSTALPSNGETFEVSGVVTDDHGVPVAGAEVTMSYWLGGLVRRPAVRTEASGEYRIAFTSNPYMIGTSGRGAARAEVVADGYEWYWRNVLATSPRLVEHFRLHRITRLTAGESTLLSVTPDNGECQGWLVGPCGRVRVAALADGNLTIEAVPTQLPSGLPQLEVCCVSGNEQYGNPVSLRVTAGTEVHVEVGQPRGLATGESVLAKTSLASF
jgi:hypothetical protein